MIWRGIRVCEVFKSAQWEGWVMHKFRIWWWWWYRGLNYIKKAAHKGTKTIRTTSHSELNWWWWLLTVSILRPFTRVRSPCGTLRPLITLQCQLYSRTDPLCHRTVFLLVFHEVDHPLTIPSVVVFISHLSFILLSRYVDNNTDLYTLLMIADVWYCWYRTQDDTADFSAELVSVSVESIADAVHWVNGLSKHSTVNQVTLCDTLHKALKIATVCTVWIIVALMMMMMVMMMMIITRLTSNLRPTTCECVQLVTHGHFWSRDKDGDESHHSIHHSQKPYAAYKLYSLCFMEPELSPIEV